MQTMRKLVWPLIAIGFLSMQAQAAEDSKSGTTASKEPTPEEIMQTFRNDLQGKRADIMAKNITLTADEAAKFWPAYSKFQDEQNVIIDEQLKAVIKYADSYANLSDADALAYVTSTLDRDAKINKLRGKWLTEFKKIVAPKTAARVMQIDRRLGLAGQLAVSARIPLIH